MTQKINFSMVLISRNEEKTLPRMLQSIKPFIDLGGDVVILDTGSSDTTVEIAKNAGCNVVEVGDKYRQLITDQIATLINEKFIIDGDEEIVKEGDTLFNFSAARNFAATLAKNDMISCQDCDEEYTKLDIDAICKLIDKGHSQFEYNFVFSHDDFGNEAIKFIQSKFYDRSKLQWAGIIHEVLQPITNDIIKRTFLPEDIFKLEHWQNHGTNRIGYLKGLALDCFMNPDNDRNCHYFARELMYHGRLHSAIKEFKRHIAMDRWPAERAQSMIYIGDCYGRLNVPSKQVEWYKKAFELDSGRREALIKLGFYYKHNNQPQKVACYMAAAEQIPWSGYYSNQKGFYENIPHELMYWAKGWLGDIQGAQYHILEALKFQPTNVQYLNDMLYYFENYPVHPSIDLRNYIKHPENLSVLNIGVGPGSSSLARQLPFFKFKLLEHIDVHQPYLDYAKQLKWRSEKVLFQPDNICEYDSDKLDEFNLILIFDVLEHLEKIDAIQLLTKIARTSCKLLMFVPEEMGDQYVNKTTVESMEHKSKWSAKEFLDYGFKVEIIQNFNYGPFVADALWVFKGDVNE